IPSKPSNTTQLLQVTATNEAGPLLLRTKDHANHFWFRTKLDPRDPDVGVDLFFEPI
ncbi:hypothetical protein M407DRAFT_242184, partial [Tulasnella calospora MUT 4182]